MRGSTGHRRKGLVILAMLALTGLKAAGLAGIGGNGLVRADLVARAWAQPDRGLQPSVPGDTVTPPPSEYPGDRPDRWLLPPDPFARPILEADGTIEAIDGTEVLLAGAALPTGPAAIIDEAPMTIDLAGDTTYYVEGLPTTFDRVPEGVPARVTYEYRGDRRVALRVEALASPGPGPETPGPGPGANALRAK